LSQSFHAEAKRYVVLVKTINGCFNYKCAICQKIFSFYDETLDCVLDHRFGNPRPIFTMEEVLPIVTHDDERVDSTDDNF
jgi:hypothetical protein